MIYPSLPNTSSVFKLQPRVSLLFGFYLGKIPIYPGSHGAWVFYFHLGFTLGDEELEPLFLPR